MLVFTCDIFRFFDGKTRSAMRVEVFVKGFVWRAVGVVLFRILRSLYRGLRFCREIFVESFGPETEVEQTSPRGACRANGVFCVFLFAVLGVLFSVFFSPSVLFLSVF